MYLPLLIVFICFCVLLFSGCLLYGIRLLDKKYAHEIAKDLTHIVYDELDAAKDPVLKEEYRLINQKFSAFDVDQKRLRSFIAHEQKNLIMLLKGKTDGYDDPYITKYIDKLSKSVDDILML